MLDNNIIMFKYQCCVDNADIHLIMIIRAVHFDDESEECKGWESDPSMGKDYYRIRMMDR